MSLVRPIPPEAAPLLVRHLYGGGDPGPITATLAQVPELCEVALPFLGAVLSPSSIPWRTKEIVILRTSVLLRCRYCVDSHTPVALDAGLSDAEVRALRDEPGTSLAAAFPSPGDRALIAWTDAVAQGRGPVAEELGSSVLSHWSEHEVVELTLLAATTMLLNRYASALGLPVAEETISRLAAEGFERAA